MLALRRVLFPTDYAPCADRAFAHASFLAGAHGAELHVLHLSPVTGATAGPPYEYHVPESVHRVDVTRPAVAVADQIVRYARDVDLVVMGTHGRRGVQRVAVGSTTERVMRRADCPVFAVGLDAERAVPGVVRRILVPVDFSDSTGGALAVADALAAVYDARVDVLHAVHLPDLPAVYGVGLHFEATYPDVVARSEEALDVRLHESVGVGRRGEVVVRVGPPGPTILEAADRLGAGLLVMPTHGRTGLERVAFGSVAEGVLRRAPCPVVALPSFGRLPLAAPVARPSHSAPLAVEQALGDALANHDA